MLPLKNPGVAKTRLHARGPCGCEATLALMQKAIADVRRGTSVQPCKEAGCKNTLKTVTSSGHTYGTLMRRSAAAHLRHSRAALSWEEQGNHDIRTAAWLSQRDAQRQVNLSTSIKDVYSTVKCSARDYSEERDAPLSISRGKRTCQLLYDEAVSRKVTIPLAVRSTSGKIKEEALSDCADCTPSRLLHQHCAHAVPRKVEARLDFGGLQTVQCVAVCLRLYGQRCWREEDMYSTVL